MIFLTFPAMLMLLIPVVIIEGLLCRKWLGLTTWDAMKSNLGSAWIGPTDNKSAWLIPAATLVLLIPFFLVSYGIEYWVIKFMVGVPEGGSPNVSYRRVRIAVRNANLITYGTMFVGTVVWLVFSLPKRG